MASIGTKQRDRKILEARGGIEPPIMVLQTIALPLGDRAAGLKSCQFSVISYQSGRKCAEASVLHLQPLGDELSFFILRLNRLQLSILSCQSEKKNALVLLYCTCKLFLP
jgi:hypothetical protein